MYNYELDTSLLPQVWLTWASTKNKQFDKRYWLNCQTNEKKETPEDWMNYDNERRIEYSRWNYLGDIGISRTRIENGKIWIKSGSSCNLLYAKYHPEIDRIELAAIALDTTRNGEHKWRYSGGRFFVAKDKIIRNEKGEKLTTYYIDKQYGYAYGFNNALSILMRRVHTANLVDEFKKFIGGDTFIIGNGSVVKIENAWDIQTWYKTVQKPRKTNKTQKAVDNIISIPLSDVSGLGKKYPILRTKHSQYYTEEHRDIIYFEKINDQWSVLRGFARQNEDSLGEIWRFYIGSNGKNIIASNANNDWIASSTVKFSWRNSYYVANIDEAVEKCNRIKYAYLCINDVYPNITKDNLPKALINMFKYPEIEQIVKIGGKSFGKNAMTSSTPIGDIKNDMGGYLNKSGSSILRKIGMTKYQFDKYYANHGDLYHSLHRLRKLFGNDISYLDNKTYDEYMNACKNMDWHVWSMLDRIDDTLNLNQLKMFKNIVRLTKKNERMPYIISDTISTYLGLQAHRRPEINFYFDDPSDAIRAHDVVVELKRIQDEEQRALWDMQAKERLKKEKQLCEKIDKERKQYEYADDKYVVRLPKDLNEIVDEGSKQHICIGSYSSRHARGDTNLFFLRRKSEDNVPFYAIEMNNNKRIIQIHGFGNKWLGNDPDAIPTVVRWLRKNGITCDTKILTCTGTSYGGGGECVPMPVVD